MFGKWRKKVLRIKYTKTKHGITSNKFIISALLIPHIEITNDAELFIKNAEVTLYFEQCTNVRNAKYRARKYIENLGYPLLTEMRKKR